MRIFWTNVVALLFVIMMNALANILPINGMTTGEISNQLDIYFTPASYVFSIWGLIYFLLAIWVFGQLPRTRRDLAVYSSCSELFWISCILNIAWLLAWHYQFFLFSTIIMVCLLITMILLYNCAKKAEVSRIDSLPFSIYLGWICVATFANISYYLVYIGNSEFQLYWTIAFLILATCIALYFLWKRKDIFLTLVFVWAFIGIGVKNAGAHPSISISAYACAVILAFFIGIALFQKKT
ncbi:TspO/MBR family protein [Gracilibacillus marinus]|uniref:TspO/MBR family protein n=1 Tax=Gracilibacillus marinus TaxID=630535 RepID=A0ABV8VSW9_9BACI